MSHAVEVSAEAAASDAAFLEQRETEGTQRFIKRHSLQARITHGVTIICCIWLMISGLFVFIPPLTQMAGAGVVLAMRMSHRVIGLVYVLVPVISAILAPKGVLHILKVNLCKWTKDDKLWMGLFFPYLFGCKWIHMPDQDDQKSGQRFADGMLWICGILMAVTGVALLLGSTVVDLGVAAHSVLLFLHDLGFFLLVIFVMAHIFLGAGIFQPYRGCYKLMFGNGMVSESDALYHWGHWARRELESGENVVVVKKDEK
ncbi:MAG: cytochrome b/b6 domain-containing protein [Coriobacteriia bacterium]|nr:cytochrome b/b6 domain-containing protein [Coriobacteriia bacterium]